MPAGLTELLVGAIFVLGSAVLCFRSTWSQPKNKRERLKTREGVFPFLIFSFFSYPYFYLIRTGTTRTTNHVSSSTMRSLSWKHSLKSVGQVTTHGFVAIIVISAGDVGITSFSIDRDHRFIL